MVPTMRRTLSNLAAGLALAMLAASGTLCAQVNPTTVKNQAQNGVNQAQQQNPPAQGQGQTQSQKQKQAATQKQNSQSQSQTPPKSPAQGTRPGTGGQANPAAKPPTTQPSKAPATNPAKPPATSGQQPPKATSKTTAPPAKGTSGQKSPQTQPKTAPPRNANTAPSGKQTPPKTTAKPPAKTPAPSTANAPRPVPPVARRDPFVMLVGKHQAEGEPVRLPPGKAGLQVNTLVIQGILSSPGGMIAVVANPQRSVYFLHAGDEIFDGRVVRIDIEGITFHEVGKDAFGKPLEREVTRKMNPSSGEQP